MKCGTGLDFGIRGDGMGIECLTHTPIVDMATLGELCPRGKDSYAGRTRKMSD